MSVRTDPFPTDLKLKFLLRGAPSHGSCILECCPTPVSLPGFLFFSHSNAKWSPRMWSPGSKTPSECLCFASNLCCTHIYLSQVLLPGPWKWLFLKVELSVWWCLLDFLGPTTEWREKGMSLSLSQNIRRESFTHRITGTSCEWVCFLMNPVSLSVICLSIKCPRKWWFSEGIRKGCYSRL